LGRSVKVYLQVAIVAAALVLASCGGHRSAGLPIQQTLVNPPSQQVLAQLEAYPCPADVDAQLWEELKSAFRTELTKSTPGSPARLLNSEDEDGHGMPCPYRSVATPPTGDTNRVNDLAIVDNGDGTYTLSWHYRNLGDYDQDGQVGIEDITPIAQHFGETYDPEAEPNCIQAVIDGSGNNKVDIADVTPIAQCFKVDCAGYRIEGADSEDGPFNLVQEVAQNAGTGDGRLEYGNVVQSPAALWHRVLPYDAEGNPGEPSNAVLRPSNEPIIYEVTPTSGYQHEEYTFSAVVSGAAPLTYAWDFGGGAEPNTPSAISPTVTLADAGEYEAILTVTNSYGEASFPFTLTVNERDHWAHTWGGYDLETAGALNIEPDGSIWTAGGTRSFGEGGWDVLVQRWSQDGETAWSRVYGGETSEVASSLCFGEGGITYLAGDRAFAPSTYTDCFLMALGDSGELLWTKVYLTADYEVASDIEAGSDGSVYICGYSVVYGGEPDVLLAKVTVDGSLLWAATWGGPSADSASALSLDEDGNVYVVGYTESYGAGGKDVLILKCDSEGDLIWGRTWGGPDSDRAGGLCLDTQGSIYVTGGTYASGRGSQEALVLKFSTEGNLIRSITWGSSNLDSFGSPVWDSSKHRLWTTGVTGDLVGQALLMQLDGDLAITLGRLWSSDTTVQTFALALDADGNSYLCGRAENTLGGWVDAPQGVVLTPDGVTGEVEVTLRSLTLSVETAEWVATSPEGVLDAGGGEEDVLILKNSPS